MGGRWNESRALAWKERLAAQQQSGLSIAEYCRREEISPPSFYVWRKRLRRQKASRRNQTARSIRTNSRLFVPVRLASGAEPVGGLRIELPGGTVVTLPAEASTELVTTALRAVLGTRPDAESSSC
jgi:hypothetical protein